jgi:hypothetical protein
VRKRAVRKSKWQREAGHLLLAVVLLICRIICSDRILAKINAYENNNTPRRFLIEITRIPDGIGVGESTVNCEPIEWIESSACTKVVGNSIERPTGSRVWSVRCCFYLMLAYIVLQMMMVFLVNS